MNKKIINRDIDAYTDTFLKLPFEDTQSEYRRKKVIEEVQKVNPRSLLEIGCGDKPIYMGMNDDCLIDFTIVEPSEKFHNAAVISSKGRANLRFFKGYLEDFMPLQGSYDMVVASCIYHEIVNPKLFLSKIYDISNLSTTIHMNVPNAFSFHRVLAVSMGIINKADQISDNQVMLQQRNVTYSLEKLISEIEVAGFEVINHGSIFVKPFTHQQMQQLVDIGFMNNKILDGLYGLAKDYPELGSEIWVNFRKK